MNKRLIASIIFIACVSSAFAQKTQLPSEKKWSFGADMNFYFLQNEFIGLPVFRADKNKLHLEARYNYEDLETFSGWIGYNFEGGKNIEYFITPMIGRVVGLTNGIAPGLEFTFNYKGFELYNESEYLFDVNSNENNFFYSWADFTYSPKDWLWLGISGQRTRLYQTELDIQRGILVGGGFKNWELTGYYYNVFSEDPFLMFSLSSNF
ncbi:MAG: hypothetical protein PSV36_05430 [Algoriphagus sp.]|nr:hypothetical protein [Algoriphagus sp.]